MEANVKKYATASYLNDVYEHRCNLSENWKLTNQAIPNLTLAQSLKYLGTAVAPRRRVKLGAVEASSSSDLIKHHISSQSFQIFSKTILSDFSFCSIIDRISFSRYPDTAVLTTSAI
jgi:hypothetical protein